MNNEGILEKSLERVMLVDIFEEPDSITKDFLTKEPGAEESSIASPWSEIEGAHLWEA